MVIKLERLNVDLNELTPHILKAQAHLAVAFDLQLKLKVLKINAL
jgi:hypothetical protein